MIRRRGGRGSATTLFVALAVLGQPVVALSAEPEAAGPTRVADAPLPSQQEERVVVRLGEVQILVTDRRGDPVVGLTPDEIEVVEAGVPRRIVALESFSTRDLSAGAPEAPAGTDSAAPIIPPPPPQRRILILFDAFNSRLPGRPAWVRAARRWVETEMRPEDRVSVALMTSDEVRTLVPYTGRRETVLATLGDENLLDGFPHQDTLADIRKYFDDLQVCDNARRRPECATTAAQSYIFEWRRRAQLTAATLDRLVGSLAAIPGRKFVIFFSEGWVNDAGSLATSAIIGRFGTDIASYSTLQQVLDARTSFDESRLQRHTTAAKVTFFTLDPRNSGLRDASFDAEQAVRRAEGTVFNPFSAAFDTTRGAMDALATTSGGRGFNGPAIDRNFDMAARAAEGVYTVTFERDPALMPGQRLKVKVRTKGAEVRFLERSAQAPPAARTVALELGVGRSPSGDPSLVVVQVQLPVSDLMLRSDDDGTAFNMLTFYAEAVTPEGRRVDEALVVSELRVSEARRSEVTGKTFVQALELRLVPGPVRIRARMGDAFLTASGERTVDLTVGPDGSLHPGIQKPVPVQESGSKEPRTTEPDVLEIRD